MRNHEAYISARSKEGTKNRSVEKKPFLKKMIPLTPGNRLNGFLAGFKKYGSHIDPGERIGWSRHSGMIAPTEKRLLASWVRTANSTSASSSDCAMILGLDMWEHSYVADYAPSGKKKYIDDFFANLNWGKSVEKGGSRMQRIDLADFFAYTYHS